MVTRVLRYGEPSLKDKIVISSLLFLMLIFGIFISFANSRGWIQLRADSALLSSPNLSFVNVIQNNALADNEHKDVIEVNLRDIDNNPISDAKVVLNVPNGLIVYAHNSEGVLKLNSYNVTNKAGVAEFQIDSNLWGHFTVQVVAGNFVENIPLSFAADDYNPLSTVYSVQDFRRVENANGQKPYYTLTLNIALSALSGKKFSGQEVTLATSKGNFSMAGKTGKELAVVTDASGLVSFVFKEDADLAEPDGLLDIQLLDQQSRIMTDRLRLIGATPYGSTVSLVSGVANIHIALTDNLISDINSIPEAAVALKGIVPQVEFEGKVYVPDSKGELTIQSADLQTGKSYEFKIKNRIILSLADFYSPIDTLDVPFSLTGITE